MNHNNFILSPIGEILKDMVSASSGVGNGIESFPLLDYIMQATFLKMTGAQEQKVKCIGWELATYDYEYRYKFTQKPLGECSSYDEKEKIFNDIIYQIVKHGKKEFDIYSIDKQKLLTKTKQLINNTFSNTNLCAWAKRSFNEYFDIWKDITPDYFLRQDKKYNLFSNSRSISKNPEDTLVKMYDHMYVHRNRIAHNTLSYQQNLPTLNILIKDENKLNNYFIYFSILILIDNIIISLYKQYLDITENN